MGFEFGAIFQALFVIINRVASWFGVGYFFTKAWREKHWGHFFTGIGLSIVMLGILVLGLKWIWDVDVRHHVPFLK